MPIPAVFLDRDGVVNELVPDPHTGTDESPLNADAVALVAGAATGIQRLTAARLVVVIASNQPSAAKGVITLSEVYAIHDRVLSLLHAAGADVAASFLCVHHPEGIDPELGQACDCRKPAPGLLMEAAEQLDLDLGRSWMIGDTDADVGAARAAGLAGVVVVTNPGSAHRRGSASAGADATFASTTAAVDHVLAMLA